MRIRLFVYITPSQGQSQLAHGRNGGGMIFKAFVDVREISRVRVHLPNSIQLLQLFGLGYLCRHSTVTTVTAKEQWNKDKQGCRGNSMNGQGRRWSNQWDWQKRKNDPSEVLSGNKVELIRFKDENIQCQNWKRLPAECWLQCILWYQAIGIMLCPS